MSYYKEMNIKIECKRCKGELCGTESVDGLMLVVKQCRSCLLSSERDGRNELIAHLSDNDLLNDEAFNDDWINALIQYAKDSGCL